MNRFQRSRYWPSWIRSLFNLKKNFMETFFGFLGGVGMQEILVIGLFVLIFFGAKKIPDFMKGLGKGVKEFKEGVKEVKQDIESTP